VTAEVEEGLLLFLKFEGKKSGAQRAVGAGAERVVDEVTSLL